MLASFYILASSVWAFPSPHTFAHGWYDCFSSFSPSNTSWSSELYHYNSSSQVKNFVLHFQHAEAESKLTLKRIKTVLTLAFICLKQQFWMCFPGTPGSFLSGVHQVNTFLMMRPSDFRSFSFVLQPAGCGAFPGCTLCEVIARAARRTCACAYLCFLKFSVLIWNMVNTDPCNSHGQ